MCGIAGVFRFDDQQIDADLLAEMSAIQLHRGPDDDGYYMEDAIGLAFRRLAILDLTPTGHQPMSSGDGSCWIVFNGEIYNHQQLRRELKQYGHSFRSTADTEVILAAYQQWGVDCLKRFNGMWAFALWDRRSQRLFCARDRMGVKPFYYHVNSERFLFASEIKALFADPATPRLPNEQSIFQYLLYGYVHFGQQTFFDSIRQLPAAHYLLVDQSGLHMERYWRIDHSRFQANMSDADAVDEFRGLFFDSVRLRLQSDVPIGTCLSGGLDSSAIVCVANRILFGKDRPDRTVVGEKQKTFSACYEDPQIDERLWIERVVAATGAQSHQTFPTGEELFAELESVVWHQDEPVAGSSIYAQWCVMRQARQAGVVVMLDGQGGDEVMAGYQRYYWAYMAGLLRAFRPVRFLQEARNPWGPSPAPTRLDWLGVAYAAMPTGLQDMVNRRQKYRQGSDWLGDAWEERYIYRQASSNHPTWLGQALERDLIAECLPALLKYEDRNSMAHSIEARVPFLDYRLVEFMASLPDSMKIRAGQTKWLLRTALKDVLPEEIFQRRSKLGFATPEQGWLARGKGTIRDYLGRGECIQRGWLKGERVEAILSHLDTPHWRQRAPFWRWLNLEVWARRFLVAKPCRPTTRPIHTAADAAH